jgi:hypothetical protein
MIGSNPGAAEALFGKRIAFDICAEFNQESRAAPPFFSV